MVRGRFLHPKALRKNEQLLQAPFEFSPPFLASSPLLFSLGQESLVPQMRWSFSLAFDSPPPVMIPLITSTEYRQAVMKIQTHTKKNKNSWVFKCRLSNEGHKNTLIRASTVTPCSWLWSEHNKLLSKGGTSAIHGGQTSIHSAQKACGAVGAHSLGVFFRWTASHRCGARPPLQLLDRPRLRFKEQASPAHSPSDVDVDCWLLRPFFLKQNKRTRSVSRESPHFCCWGFQRHGWLLHTGNLS